jgi:hypothetical protein
MPNKKKVAPYTHDEQAAMTRAANMFRAAISNPSTTTDQFDDLLENYTAITKICYEARHQRILADRPLWKKLTSKKK